MSEVAVIGNYDIRDKKLADATSKSSVATTDSIRMKDTNGNEVYIARDSFVNAVRSALGPILTNMTQKTAASNGILVNDSNDVGTMNLSNLASVLGVKNLVVSYLGNARAGYNLSGISSDGVLASFKYIYNDLYFAELVIALSGTASGTSVAYFRGGAYGGTWKQI